MKKKIVFILLSALLVLGVSACSNSGKSGNSEAASESTSTADESTEAQKDEVERNLTGLTEVTVEEAKAVEQLTEEEVGKATAKQETVDEDGNKLSQAAAKASKKKNKVKKVVKKAQKVYKEAQEKSKKAKVSAENYSVYVDKSGTIREVIAFPKLYDDIGNKTVRKATAYYYYDVPEEGFSKLCFVYVKKADGGEVRFYISSNKNCAYACYRCIEDGVTTDYPKGVNPRDISSYGVFCSKGYMEPHWFGQQ